MSKKAVMSIYLVVILGILIFAAGTVYFLFFKPSADAAVVNGEKIPVSVYKDYLKNQKEELLKSNPNIKWDEQYSSGKTFEDIFKENTVNSLVSIYAAAQEAQSEKITLTDSDISKIKKHYPYIKNEELIKKIAMSNKLYDLKTRGVEVSDEKVKEYYEEHPEQFITGDIYRIDVKDIKTAETVVKAFLKGDKFEDLAKKYSIDFSSKDNGGFIGNMPLSQYSSVINYDLTRIKEGQITEPINRGNYYEIVMVKNISQKSFEEVKDYLKAWLADAQKQDIVANTAKEIIDKAKIKINWDVVYRVDIGKIR